MYIDARRVISPPILIPYFIKGGHVETFHYSIFRNHFDNILACAFL